MRFVLHGVTSLSIAGFFFVACGGGDEGGVAGTGGSGAVASGGASSGGSGTGGGKASSDDDDGGCGCRAPGRSNASALGALLVLAALGRVRGFGRRPRRP